MKTRTLSPRNLISRSPLRAFLLTPFVLACFALSPRTQAVDPPPGDFYPGDNTASGEDALFSLDTSAATDNVALGHDALFSCTTGINNTATGDDALAENIVGFNNTAHGWHALKQVTGNLNTGVGCDALTNSTTGDNNIALGYRAGVNLNGGSNNIDIGNTGVFGESNTIRIGTTGTQTGTFVAGIRGVAITGAQQVGVSASGQLGIRTSSARFKEAISSMDKSSEAILALRPVGFRYKKELDPKGEPQFGLIAEEVAKVHPDLVVADGQGKPFTVRYEEINVMLLNEFLKEHKKVEQLEATVAKLAAAVEKVSAQLQVNKPTPQVVLNKR
jgi:trimeric autotransporter adhesin